MSILFWSGFGWLAFPIVFAAGFASLKTTEALGHPKPPVWMFVVGCIVAWALAAGTCWPIGRWFNRRLPIRVYDLGPGFTSEGHTAMGFRLEFAGLILGAGFYLIVPLVIALVAWV